MDSVLYNIPLTVFAIILFIVILLAHVAGVQTGNFQRQKNSGAAAGIGPLETSLLGLLSLLLSFTFSMSASRNDARRTAIITEANVISTAILNTDLYPDSIRNDLRKELQQYLEERINYYKYNDEKDIQAALVKAQTIYEKIAKTIALLAHDPAYAVMTNQMVPALHHAADSITTRDALRTARVPYSIIWLLVILTLLGSFIIGYAKLQIKNDWIIVFIYALMTVITLVTILDLDNSKGGLIKMDATHIKIEELRTMFKK